MLPMATITTDEVSSSSANCLTYDVFLSFHGEDTRNSFTGHLYTRLKDAGVHTFLDDCELPRGENITEKLVQAIRGSKISVIVFSRGYATSSWCLDELVEILGCKRRNEQRVLPIFFYVDPTDVRKQTGFFGDAFYQKHQDQDKKKIEEWKCALKEAADLSGWDFKNNANGHEATFIQNFVEHITRELPTTYLLSIAPQSIGLTSRLADLISCLHIEAKGDVRISGILGMGGVGKTTLAKAITDRFYRDFQGKVSFLENVRETTKHLNGLVGLQNQLLADILKPTKLDDVRIVDRGKSVIKQRLQHMRVLIIIDDVDDMDHLDALAGDCDWFGEGSRIIITTRNERLLKRVTKDSIYRVQPMHKVESLQLFCWHAFRNSSHPKDGYLELSERAVSYCAGVPLALKVVGSSLYGKDTHDWESHLERLRNIPDDRILQKLRVCYDGLSDRQEKDIFLDIACFFIGMDKDYVTVILDGCDFFSGIGIKVLIDRCLLTLTEENKLTMHDLIRDMGRAIVCENYRDEPEKRSRLWHPKDVQEVLTETSGTEAIEGLSTLNISNSEVKSFSAEAFLNMKRLRLLQLNHVNLTGDYKYLSKKNLRWLCWHGFSLCAIPREFDLRSLVVIDLKYSKLEKFWDDPQYVLEKLKILNLSHSHDLMHSPDFSRLPNLEQLILKDCKSLCEVHQSICTLQLLHLVNLKDCKMLKFLPSSFYRSSIKTLNLSGTNLARSSLEMVSSRTQHAVAITNVLRPSPILRLEGSLFRALTELNLSRCNLTDDSIFANLTGVSLMCLDLTGNGFCSLNNLSCLKVEWLLLDECKDLLAITELPVNLDCLFVSDCISLETLPNYAYDENYCFDLGMLNCPKLIKFPGLVDWVNGVQGISIEGHYSNISSPLKKAILQERNIFRGDGLSFPANEVPGWCSHVNYGGHQVCFNAPSGRDAIITVYFVYSSSVSKSDFGPSFMPEIVVVNRTRRTAFSMLLLNVYAPDSSKKYIWLVTMLLEDGSCMEGCDDINLGVVPPRERFKVHQIGVEILEGMTDYFCLPTELISIPYEKGLDLLNLGYRYVHDDGTEDSVDDDGTEDSVDDYGTEDSVDDDGTEDSVDMVVANYNPSDAAKGIIGDYGEDELGGARRDPVDQDRSTNRQRRSDPTITSISKDEQLRFTSSPSHAHFDPTQFASSSQQGSENVYHQQQMIIQQLRSENEEFRRQLMLSQQPPQIPVERNFQFEDLDKLPDHDLMTQSKIHRRYLNSRDTCNVVPNL